MPLDADALFALEPLGKCGVLARSGLDLTLNSVSWKPLPAGPNDSGRNCRAGGSAVLQETERLQQRCSIPFYRTPWPDYRALSLLDNSWTRPPELVENAQEAGR
jgi:hypothetical protein